MRFWLTVLFVLILIGSAYRFGRGPERAVANLLGANLFLSILNRAIGTPSFNEMNYVLALIDSITLIAVTWVALRANRVWPLCTSALQLIVIVAHASVLVSIGWTQVYYGMMALAQYFELVVLAIGIACHHVREKRVGRYREWRHGHEPGSLKVPGYDVIPKLADRQSSAIHVARS